MKIEFLEIEDTDEVMIFQNIGNVPAYDVDKYCEKYIELLKPIFKCPIALFPIRNGEDWKFYIVRHKQSLKV